MSLIFRNHYSFTPGFDVYVIYMRLDTATCGANGFAARGWYRVPPGGEVTVYNGNVDNVNRYWYWYAESTDGATWSGPFQTWVSNNAFTICYGAGCTPCRVVGLQELDVNNNNNFRVTLTA